MADMSWKKLCNRGWLPRPRGNAQQRPRIRSGKEDRSVGIPCTAASSLAVGNGLRRTASDCDAFQLAAGKEANGSAIGRPEGILRVFGSRKRLRGGGIERAHPQSAHHRMRQTPAAGRRAREQSEGDSQSLAS
jgi:hypothetical protein